MRFKVITSIVSTLLLSTTVIQAQSFGSSLAAGPGEILIGEPVSQYAPGVINVYKLESGSWKRVSGITAPGGHALDRFGRSLSLDGNRLLVGATSFDDKTQGGAFIYERDRAGNWQLITRLRPAGADSGDAYGRLVRLSGDDALVVSWGAHEGRGVISTWRRGANGQWTEGPAISASDGAQGSFFGGSISVDGNRMAVGAAQRDTARGHVYVFERERAGGAWVEQSHFRPADLPAGASFGAAVVVQGDQLIVAAPGADSARGALFVYARDGAGQWVLREKIAPPEISPGAQFGSPLQLVGHELWAGAQGANRNKGAVYRLTRGAGGRWSVAGVIEAQEGDQGDFFGGTFAVSGDYGVIGLPNDDYGAGTAAFVSRKQGSWTVSPKVWTEVPSLAAATGSKRNCSAGKIAEFECQDVSLLAFLPTRSIGGGRGVAVSGVWGWTDPTTNREYAIVGRMDGTSFIDVTDPVNPRYLGDLPKTDSSPANIWREIKVYKNHAYIVADGAAQHGMQVFDLTRLRNVPSAPQAFRPDTTYHRIASAHNIVIDTVSGFAFATGANSGGETCGGALHMIDIRDPRVPRFAGCFSDPQTGIQRTGYTHDAQCVVYNGPDSSYRGRQICINSSETAIGIADVTDKANPKSISRASYPNVGYTHQGWFSEDQRYFYVNDEGDEVSGTVPGTRTLIWDLADLDDPVIASEYISDNTSSDHNLYIKGNLMYQSNYESGLRILDISDPVKPRLVAHLDTTPTGEEDAPGFNGSWSNYPFFKSGTIVVTSIGEGVFLVQGPVRPAIP